MKKNKILYTGKNDWEINKWSNGRIYSSSVLEPTKENPSGSYIQIKNPDGIITAIVGDLIVKNKNKFFVIKIEKA